MGLYRAENETLTCVGRYVGTSLSVAGTAFQYGIYRNGTGENLYITVAWVGDASTLGTLPELLQCTLNGTAYSFATMIGWRDPVCVLPYVPEPTQAEIDAGMIVPTYALVPTKLGGRLTYSYNDTKAYTLRVGQYTTLPQLTMQPVTLYGNHSQRIRWTLDAGDGRSGWVTTMTMESRAEGAETKTVLFQNTLHVYYQLATDGTIVGKEARLVLEYRTYPTDWNGYDLDAFATLNRYCTPWQEVERDASIPLAPETITTSMLLSGGKTVISWVAVVDPLNTIQSYKLERSVDGGAYVVLYSGTSTQFRDMLSKNATKVEYRVCAVNPKNATSPWTTTGEKTIAQSNLYVAKDGKWVRAAGVWVGDKRASPMLQVT